MTGIAEPADSAHVTVHTTAGTYTTVWRDDSRRSSSHPAARWFGYHDDGRAPLTWQQVLDIARQVFLLDTPMGRQRSMS